MIFTSMSAEVQFMIDRVIIRARCMQVQRSSPKSLIAGLSLTRFRPIGRDCPDHMEVREFVPQNKGVPGNVSEVRYQWADCTEFND